MADQKLGCVEDHHDFGDQGFNVGLTRFPHDEPGDVTFLLLQVSLEFPDHVQPVTHSQLCPCSLGDPGARHGRSNLCLGGAVHLTQYLTRCRVHRRDSSDCPLEICGHIHRQSSANVPYLGIWRGSGAFRCSVLGFFRQVFAPGFPVLLQCFAS